MKFWHRWRDRSVSGPRQLAELSKLLDAMEPYAPLAERHGWLIELLSWIRGNGSDVRATLARVDVFLDAVQARPEWIPRWRLWWAQFISAVDATPLLADFGFAPRTAFLSEFGHRLRRKMLPGTPETTDLAELFSLLLPSKFDSAWIRALDQDTLSRVQSLLFTNDVPLETTAASNAKWESVLLDGLAYSVTQVTASGFASEIRVRMSASAKEARAFHRLPAQFEIFRHAVLAYGPRSVQGIAAADVLRENLDACRHAAYSVYAHLEEHGISVGIVFRLRQLRERVVRIKELLDCLQSDVPSQGNARLIASLAQIGHDNRSVRALIAASFHLTAAKVAERNAESGENYITRDRAGYLSMLRKALGGGVVIAFTVWARYAIYALGLSMFWGGFAAGINYSLSFVIVQLLHWTVATKQPAVTAPAMAAKLKDVSAPGAIDAFVAEVANLFRSQVAAILGNISAVIPVVLLINLATQWARGHHMLTADQAQHAMQDLSLAGPTVLFAAFTGILLFVSSIVAGWVENWFVFYRLDSALEHNPRFTRLLGRARAERWARFMRANISGFAASISLGFLLGLVPPIAAFFGLPIEARHVTLSTGQLTGAAAAIGTSVFNLPAFWWAVAGVSLIGPLNLGVSFYFAFRLALAAHSVTRVDRKRIRAALWAGIKSSPGSFLVPPKMSAADRQQ